MIALWLSIALWCPVGIDDPAPPHPAEPAAESPFLGTWDSTYGRLEIARQDSAIVGRYPGGTIHGRLEAGRLTFRYQEADVAGDGWFELDPEQNRFSGKWRPDGGEAWLDWTGTRIAPPPHDFTGLWQSSFGRMRLTQTGDRVEGRYSLSGDATPSGATLSGSIRDGELTFVYHEPTITGEGWFALSPDGRRFEGQWRAKGETGWRPWIGTRIEPVPGRVWLVVLEAHWEESLAERPYAFGDMLRSYFQMAQARHVEVRQRYFHDKVDLKRFAAEVAYLAEPVVLVISSHGTHDGVTVGGVTIGATELTECLRGLDHLELVHLSGCSMADGDLIERVRSALPAATRPPISGYSTPVAWDASAIADFVFLSFVLIHRLSPLEAWRQACRVAPFIGDDAPPGSAYRSLGLRVRSDVPAADTSQARKSGSEQDLAAAKSILSHFHRAAATADFDGYFELLTEDAIFLGTDATERWTKTQFAAFARPHFRGESAWTFTPIEQNVSLDPSGHFAWFDEQLDSASYGLCRGSGVLRRTESGWRIAQYNLTVPIPNPLLRDVVARIREPEAGATRVILVRHAEKENAGRDPKLSEAGRQRAARLATWLAGVPIDAVIATRYQRTQATAAPTASAKHLAIEVLPSVADVKREIHEKWKGHTVLYVGHSNTVPELIGALGIATPPKLEDGDYDDLFIVTLTPGAAPQLQQLEQMAPAANENAPNGR